jgi:hypothetical protein
MAEPAWLQASGSLSWGQNGSQALVVPEEFDEDDSITETEE